MSTLHWEDEQRPEPDPNCTHASVMPSFDEERAKAMSSDEVRRTFPRFSGICPDCGGQWILYATFQHYIAGDW